MQRRWMLDQAGSNDWCGIPTSQWITQILHSVASPRPWSIHQISHLITPILHCMAKQKECNTFWRNMAWCPHCKWQMVVERLGNARLVNCHMKHRSSSAVKHRHQCKVGMNCQRVNWTLCRNLWGQTAACAKCLQISTILKKRSHLSRV